MAGKELKWYSIFVVLFGAILSIANPITDVLTLVEFYRTGHTTWFGVGLTFIILPSLFFLLINYVINEDTWSDDEECQSKACKFTRVLFLGCNPLLPACLKLRTLYCYLKKGQVALEDKTVYLCQKSVITIKNQVRPVCSPKDKIWSQTDKLQRCRRLPLEQAKLRQILENNSQGVLIRK